MDANKIRIGIRGRIFSRRGTEDAEKMLAVGLFIDNKLIFVRLTLPQLIGAGGG